MTFIFKFQVELQVTNLEDLLKVYESECRHRCINIERSNFSIPNLKVILVNSKVERNTSRMVQAVKEKMKRVRDC